MVCVKNGVAVWKAAKGGKANKSFVINGKSVIDYILIGDMYKCPSCNHSIVIDFSSPISNNGFNQGSLRKIRDTRKVTIELSDYNE